MKHLKQLTLFITIMSIFSTGLYAGEIIGDIDQKNQIDVTEAIYALQVSSGLRTQMMNVQVDSGYIDMVGSTQEYIEIPHKLGRLPGIIEIIVKTGANQIFHSKWISTSDGKGMLVCKCNDHNQMIKVRFQKNTDEIGRHQTGDSDVQYFQIEPYADKIIIKRGRIYGDYEPINFDIFWIVQ